MFARELELLDKTFEGSIKEEILQFAIEREIKIRNDSEFEEFCSLSSVALPGLRLEIEEGVGIGLVVKALKQNKKIGNIRLRIMDDAGTEQIAEALKTNTTLTTLDLNNTPISDRGAIAISNALKTNNTLKTLDLSDTQVSDQVRQSIERKRL